MITIIMVIDYHLYYVTELDLVFDNSLLLYEKSLMIKVPIKMWLWLKQLSDFKLQPFPLVEDSRQEKCI